MIIFVSFLNLSSALLSSPSLSTCIQMLPTFYIHITQKIKVLNSGSTSWNTILPNSISYSLGKVNHLFVVVESNWLLCFLSSSSVKHVYLSSYFLFLFSLYFMRNPVDNPLLPIYRRPQMLPPNTDPQSFGLKQTSGGCGQNINSHPSELQGKQIVFGILKTLLEYCLGIQLCSTEPAKDF